MGNMSYCMFTNTLGDLQECYNNMERREMIAEEKINRRKLVGLCQDIVDEYGEMYLDQPPEDKQ